MQVGLLARPPLDPRIFRIVCAVLLLTQGSCATQAVERTLVLPADTRRIEKARSPLKAHARSGEVYLLSPWRIDEEERMLLGTGQRLSVSRETIEEGELRVSLDSLLLLEINVTRRSRHGIPLFLLTSGSLVLAAYCAANPDQCFEIQFGGQ